MSDPSLPADQSDATSLESKVLATYFVVLFAMTLLATTPDALTIATLLFVLPGLALIASVTLLYYSVALIPAYIAFRCGKKLLAVPIALICLAAAALLPYYTSRHELDDLVASDHSDPLVLQPLSFELPYAQDNVFWTNKRRPESRESVAPPACADLCQQLLFKGHAEKVVIRDPTYDRDLDQLIVTETYETNPDGSKKRIHHVSTPPKWRRFRLEQRETCPDTLSLIEGQFVNAVIGGLCLVEDIVHEPKADVALSTSAPTDPVPANDRRSSSCQPLGFSVIEAGPKTVTIRERRGNEMIAVEVKTTLAAHHATYPVYFIANWRGLLGCIGVASEPFPGSVADPYEMMARRYGMALSRTPVSARALPTPLSTRNTIPAPEDPSKIDAILKHDYSANETMTTTESRLVASFITSKLKGGLTKPDDVELIRLVLKQHAFTEAVEADGLPPASYRALGPLLPDMFERIADRSNEQEKMVQFLNVMLDHFSAEETDPYSEKLCQDQKFRDLRVCYKREFRLRK